MTIVSLVCAYLGWLSQQHKVALLELCINSQKFQFCCFCSMLPFQQSNKFEHDPWKVAFTKITFHLRNCVEMASIFIYLVSLLHIPDISISLSLTASS